MKNIIYKVEAIKELKHSLKQILPEKIAEELNSSGLVRPRKYEDIAILVCDLVGFTAFVNPTHQKMLSKIFKKFLKSLKAKLKNLD